MEDRFKFRTFHKPTKVMEYNGLWSGKDWDRKVNDTNFVLMQCTGLKDKNGKLIYEGDIVEILKFGYTNYIQKIMIVKWYQNQSSFRLFDIEALGATPQKIIEKRAMGAIDTMEVIGNIYENAELLKEAKE